MNGSRKEKKQRLINAAGIGRVTLDSGGAPVAIAEIYADKPPLIFESELGKHHGINFHPST